MKKRKTRPAAPGKVASRDHYRPACHRMGVGSTEAGTRCSGWWLTPPSLAATGGPSRTAISTGPLAEGLPRRREGAVVSQETTSGPHRPSRPHAIRRSHRVQPPAPRQDPGVRSIRKDV